jgi:phosphoribosylglycinamide formyltransferase-1
MTTPFKIGTLISGGGTNLQAIIDACRDGRIPAKIMFTGSDTPGVKGLDRAEQAGIATFVVDYQQIITACRDNGIAPDDLPDDFNLAEVTDKQNLMDPADDRTPFFLQSRAMAEKKLLAHILPYDIDLLVLAGFMRVLTPYFIDRINTVPGQHRIMNIHPALLPAFPGTDGY